MGREIFGENFFEGKKDQRRKEVPGAKPRAWTEEGDAEEKEAAEHAISEKLYKEATQKYEEALGVQPPEDWTTEQITEAVEKKAAREDKILSEVHQPSGLDSRRMRQNNRRGHRKGLKPIKHREAA